MAESANRQLVLPDPSQKMGFDGERYVSGVAGEIAHEHYLRYFFALQFCTGKAVLDIASGEGYGSRMLGQVAASVCGVDLSTEAVEFAQQQYGSPTVRFSRGDVREIPHASAAFDVVVSFETLEHVAEHEQFLDEVRRVLRPNGVLVMSSPNRDVYLKDLPPNPFHLRELNRGEFGDLMSRSFQHVSFGQQRSLTGAVLFPENGRDPHSFNTFTVEGTTVDVTDELSAATYLMAVASDGPVPEIAWSILVDPHYVPDLRMALYQRH